MDAAGAAALQEAAARIRGAGAQVTLAAADEGVKALLRTLPAVQERAEGEGPVGTFEVVGGRALDFLADAGELATLLKEVLLRGVVDPFRGKLPSMRQTAKEAVRIGVDALPIVALIGLLLGLIIGPYPLELWLVHGFTKFKLRELWASFKVSVGAAIIMGAAVLTGNLLLPDAWGIWRFLAEFLLGVGVLVASVYVLTKGKIIKELMLLVKG